MPSLSQVIDMPLPAKTSGSSQQGVGQESCGPFQISATLNLIKAQDKRIPGRMRGRSTIKLPLTRSPVEYDNTRDVALECRMKPVLFRGQKTGES